MTNGLVPSPPQSPTQIPSPTFSALPPSVPFDRHIRRGQEEYAHALSALLPQGIAWPRWSETRIMQFVYGLAGIMGWVDGRAADLLERESDPRATTEMLDSWEKAWGLPDPCFKEPQSVEERRKLLVLKMTLLGAQSREFFIGVANFLGYQISISEYRPFMAGVDRCGDCRTYNADGSLSDYPYQLGHPQMRFAWTVHVKSDKLVWFRAGSGQCGIDPLLKIARATDLECLLRRWGPAHTLPLFDYSGVSDPFAGADRWNVTLRNGEPVALRDSTIVVDTRPIAVVWPPPGTYLWLGSPTFDSPPLTVASAIPDPSTQAWVSAVLTLGGTVSAARQTAIDLLVKGLKADGLWSTYDRVWLAAGENQAAGLLDLVALARATNVNAAFGVDRGFVSVVGTGGYVNINFNPATAPNRKYQRNSAHVLVWSLGGAAQSFNTVFGQLSTPVGCTLMSLNDIQAGVPTQRYAYFGINDSQTRSWAFSFNDTIGYGCYAMNRSGPSLSQAFHNGRQIQFSNNPSIAPESSPFTFLKANLGGTDYFSTHQISIIALGASLTIDQHAKEYNRFLGYMRAINAPVTP